jgi:hypothetical protein
MVESFFQACHSALDAAHPSLPFQQVRLQFHMQRDRSESLRFNPPLHRSTWSTAVATWDAGHTRSQILIPFVEIEMGRDAFWFADAAHGGGIKQTAIGHDHSNLLTVPDFLRGIGTSLKHDQVR